MVVSGGLLVGFVVCLVGSGFLQLLCVLRLVVLFCCLRVCCVCVRVFVLVWVFWFRGGLLDGYARCFVC